TEVLLDDRRIAEEITEQAEPADPEYPAADVEGEEADITHAADARDERRERAYDRHETREHDGFAAVLLVEALRAQQVLPLEQPARLGEHAGAHAAADPIVHVVADDRRG